MRRTCLAVVTGMSAVLMLSICLLWLRSLSSADWIEHEHGHAVHRAWSAKGCLLISVQILDEDVELPHRLTHSVTALPSDSISGGPYHAEIGWVHRIAQFEIGYVTGGDMVWQRRWWIVLPDWFLILLSAILPVRWIGRLRRRRMRARQNRCAKCGYDLRGSPTRCPECGRTVAVGAPIS